MIQPYTQNRNWNDKVYHPTSITTLQRLARSWLLRQNTFYQELCTRTDQMPKALGGNNSWVFLPPEAPRIVLKTRRYGGIGSHSLSAINNARTLLKTLGSRQLIVPWSKQCGDYLITERLPIKTDSRYNWRLYCSETELFDPVVREMALYFTKAYQLDILQLELRHSEPFLVFNRESLVKYENIPLYIVEINGKREARLGLIDLKFMIMGRLDDFPLERRFSDLAKIFPLHLDILIEEAKKHNVNVTELMIEKKIEQIMAPLRQIKEQHIEVTPEFKTKSLTLIQQMLLDVNWDEDTQRWQKQGGYKNETGQKLLKEIKAAEGIADKIFVITIDTANRCLDEAKLESRPTPKGLDNIDEAIAPFADQIKRVANHTFKLSKLYEPLKEFMQSDPYNIEFGWTDKTDHLCRSLACAIHYQNNKIKFKYSYPPTDPDATCTLAPQQIDL